MGKCHLLCNFFCWKASLRGGIREEEGGGPKVLKFKSSKDQDISKSQSNTSLTLKKVHLVFTYFSGLSMVRRGQKK